MIGTRTFIYGSCVSRDTFEFLDDFSLTAYVARQSFISAGNSVRGVKEKLKPISSPFQKRMVEGDLAGSLPRDLQVRAAASDIVLIDIIDERGGVVEFDEGAYATRLAEFWSAGGREASAGHLHLELGSDEHFEKWKLSARKVVCELLSAGLLHRTAVLKTPWAELTDEEKKFEIPAWMTPPAVANAAYARYYDFLEALGLHIIELPPELVRTSEGHRWGMSPFHYTAAAYEHLASRIRAFARSLDGPQTFEGLPRRNTAQWGAFSTLGNPSDFAEIEDANGRFTCSVRGLPIDFWVEDNESDTTLVVFHAALGAAPLDPPVFTGRSATDGLGVNRIFFSDPGLLAGSDLGLAWFLGTSQVDGTSVIAEVVSAVQKRLGAAHLAFFGMSGGGFASLNISQRFPGSAAIPVNPQTNILRYAPVHWTATSRACFGAKTDEAAEALLAGHPRADQCEVYSRGFENSVIYVQNSKDPHVSSHLIPFFEAIGWGGDAAVLTDDWGTGHVPPKPAELRRLLSSLSEVHGDWAELAQLWNAESAPTREWVKSRTGR